MLIGTFLITKTSGTISYSDVHNLWFTVYTYRLNAFFTMVLLLFRSHLCTVFVDPPPAPHALDHITHFVQFAEFAKPARPTFCNAFWEGKLALVSSTWNFIFQQHFVRCAGEDCSSRCLSCPYSIAFRQRWYFFNLPVRSCRLCFGPLFSWRGLEEVAAWHSVTEFVGPADG
jgi:hypothetical protein